MFAVQHYVQYLISFIESLRRLEELADVMILLEITLNSAHFDIILNIDVFIQLGLEMED